MRIRLLFYCLVFLSIFIFPSSAKASRLYVLPLQNYVAPGDTFLIEIRLDTQGTDINALDIQLEFPEDVIEFKSASDAASLVNLWIDTPKVFKPKQCIGKITPCSGIKMSGVAPGGFVGDGIISRLTLVALKEGDFEILFSPESKIVLNSAEGILSYAITNGAKLTVGETKNPLEQSIADMTPPDYFKVYIEHGQDAFDGKWFLSFVARDKESGIAYYEIQEKLFGIFDGNWDMVLGSPYVLRRQHLFSVIRIKAVDGAGLAQITTLMPRRMVVVYVGLSFILILCIIFLLRKKIFHKRMHIDKATSPM